MKRRPHRLLAGVLCLTLAAAATSRAQSVLINPLSYGWLDQYSITEHNFVGNEACVPTSSTNALQYLQTVFPQYFGTSLILDVPGNTQYENWMATDELLISPAYYNTTASLGTYDYRFVHGIYKYMVETNGFTYTYFNGIFPDDDFTPEYPQPSYILTGKPDAAFYLSELAASSAIVTLIDYTNGAGGHGILINGIDWDSANNVGTLYFIDPLDPSATYNASGGNTSSGYPSGLNKQTSGTLELDEHGALKLHYNQYQGSLPYSSSDYEFVTATLSGVLAINVPEPADFAEVAGLAAVAFAVWRRRSRRISAP